MTRRFCIGRTVITQGALVALSGDDVAGALRRHERGDWGELGETDWMSNERALRSGERLVSVYRARGGTKFPVITEHDRSLTTVLLPEEY